MTVEVRNHLHPNPLPGYRERGPEASGEGFVELTKIAGRTVPTRLQASSPLRLLSPRSPGTAAWIFAGTYGGGLVGGDDVRLRIDAGAGTRCLLSTQASTKVYRTQTEGCRQELHATIASDAMLVSVPDPVVCFDGSRYEQVQQFSLADSASLVAVDSFTSGRCGRGERWMMERYTSRTEVMQKDRCIFRDVMRLDPIDGPIGGMMRMGRCDCFASLLIVGTPLLAAVNGMLKLVAAQPAGGALLFGASPINSGVIVRVAGDSSEAVMAWVRERMTFLMTLIGGDARDWNHWARKR